MEQLTRMKHHRPLASFILQALIPLICLIGSHSVGSSLYSVKGSSRPHDHQLTIFRHLNEPFDHEISGQLNIDLIETTTSSIHVQWSLTNLTYPDSVVESTVLCETPHGKIVSDKLHSQLSSFNFHFLASNTKYLVCVYLLEKSKSTNTSVLHYNCQPFSTIPVIRPDSIVGVILTVGYLLLMGAVGCFTWYRRIIRIKKGEEKDKAKIKITEDCFEDDSSHSGKASCSKRTVLYKYVIGDAEVLNGNTVLKANSSSIENVDFSTNLTDQISSQKQDISFQVT